MIKAVIFDYGGVISAGGKKFEPAIRLANNLGINYEEALILIRQPWNKLSTGEINEIEFWDELENSYKIPIKFQSRNIWNTYENCMKPLKEMQDLLYKLKSSGFTLGLISNTVPPTALSIKLGGGYKLFDFCVLSCEVGFQKPDIDIYKFGLEHIKNTPPGSVLYIDDVSQNLIPAEGLGMKVIHATNSSNLIKKLSFYLKELS